MILAGCTSRTEADTGPPGAPRPSVVRPRLPWATASPAASAPAAPRETCLGVADQGIWADLDDEIQIDLPADLTADHVSARIDDRHGVLVLSIDGVARKVYPLGGPAGLAIGDRMLALRPGDRAELAPLVVAERVASGPSAHDRDDDGIPDPLQTAR